MQTILRTSGLIKTYKKVQAVKELDMTIGQGEIYGFLGQNGAGKTTAIRMIMGLITPTAGQIELFGEKVKPGNHRIYRKVGSIIEYPGFYPNLTGVENLEIARRQMGLSRGDHIEEALVTVGLWEARNRRASQYSLGMKQRLGIARAILHRPEFLILDEPTNGLDPIGIKEIRHLIIELAQKRNITILVSSHILSEIELLATRIGIIHKGVMLEETEMSALKARNQQYIELLVDRPEEARKLLSSRFGISECQDGDGGVLRIYERLNDAGQMNRELIQAGILVSGLTQMKDSLEDVFVRMIGGSTVA